VRHRDCDGRLVAGLLDRLGNDRFHRRETTALTRGRRPPVWLRSPRGHINRLSVSPAKRTGSAHARESVLATSLLTTASKGKSAVPSRALPVHRRSSSPTSIRSAGSWLVATTHVSTNSAGHEAGAGRGRAATRSRPPAETAEVRANTEAGQEGRSGACPRIRQRCASPRPRRSGAAIGHADCPPLPRLREPLVCLPPA
jgi:hypothetical protein